MGRLFRTLLAAAAAAGLARADDADDALAEAAAKVKGPVVRLVADDAPYRALVPASADGRLRGLADDRRTVFYDEASMPRLYQGLHLTNSGATREQSLGWNDAYVRPNDIDPFGNLNREFPWDRSAGLTAGDNAASFKFVRLPAGGFIDYWWEDRVPPRGGGAQHALVRSWRYPAGTEFGNVKLVLGPGGRRKAFEVELRRRDDRGWAPAVYRPVATAEEYAAAVGAPPVPPGYGYEGEREEVGGSTRFTRLADAEHTRAVFDRRAHEHVLPPADAGLVDGILARPFRPVTGPWKVFPDGVECAAPTTGADYGIVPKGYNGAWLKVGREECATCHSGCGTLHANEAQFGRDWYGYVRGADGIFSFQIADPRLAPLLRGVR